jgi:hypothetical protein
VSSKRFYVDVQVGSTWVRRSDWGRCQHALSYAEILAKVEIPGGSHAFSGVRVRYAGLTIARWKDGWPKR